MGNSNKYQKAINKLDRLVEKNTKKINLKAGLTISDLWYQVFAKPSLGNNFYRVTIIVSVALSIALIIILFFFIR